MCESAPVVGFRITARIGIDLVHFEGWLASEFRASGMELPDSVPDCAVLKLTSEGYRWSWFEIPVNSPTEEET